MNGTGIIDIEDWEVVEVQYIGNTRRRKKRTHVVR